MAKLGITQVREAMKQLLEKYPLMYTPLETIKKFDNEIFMSMRTGRSSKDKTFISKMLFASPDENNQFNTSKQNHEYNSRSTNFSFMFHTKEWEEYLFIFIDKEENIVAVNNLGRYTFDGKTHMLLSILISIHGKPSKKRIFYHYHENGLPKSENIFIYKNGWILSEEHLFEFDSLGNFLGKHSKTEIEEYEKYLHKTKLGKFD
jgi:hypothetical protein